MNRWTIFSKLFSDTILHQIVANCGMPVNVCASSYPRLKGHSGLFCVLQSLLPWTVPFGKSSFRKYFMNQNGVSGSMVLSEKCALPFNLISSSERVIRILVWVMCDGLRLTEAEWVPMKYIVNWDMTATKRTQLHYDITKSVWLLIPCYCIGHLKHLCLASVTQAIFSWKEHKICKTNVTVHEY